MLGSRLRSHRVALSGSGMLVGRVSLIAPRESDLVAVRTLSEPFAIRSPLRRGLACRQAFCCVLHGALPLHAPGHLQRGIHFGEPPSHTKGPGGPLPILPPYWPTPARTIYARAPGA